MDEGPTIKRTNEDYLTLLQREVEEAAEKFKKRKCADALNNRPLLEPRITTRERLASLRTDDEFHFDDLLEEGANDDFEISSGRMSTEIAWPACVAGVPEVSEK